MREGRAEPATSVRGATHIQVVSRATRDQADPLAPAGRRFGNFVFGATMDSRVWGERSMMRPPAARARWEVRGIAKQAALKDQRYRAPSTLLAPKSSCARGAPSQRRRSAERPTFSGQQSDRDQADPLAPAGRRFGNFVFGGERWSSGVGANVDLRPPRAGARWI